MPTKEQSLNLIDIYEKESENAKLLLLSDPNITGLQKSNILEFLNKTRNLIKAEQERIEDKLNADFVQLYRKNIQAVVELGQKSQLAVLIFIYLLRIIDRKNSVVISQDTLAEIFKVSRMTIYRAQKALEESKFIQVAKVGTANAYFINSELVWTTYNDQKKLAHFTAHIVVSQSEQANKKIKVSKLAVAHFKEASVFKQAEAELEEELV